MSERKKFNETGEEVCLTKCEDWGSVKRKEVKNLLLEGFAITRSAECGWTKAKTRRFLSALLLAVQLKAIQNDDVHMEAGRITKIEGSEKIENLEIDSWEYSWRSKPEQVQPKLLVSNS